MKRKQWAFQFHVSNSKEKKDWENMIMPIQTWPGRESKKASYKTNKSLVIMKHRKHSDFRTKQGKKSLVILCIKI